jgi:ribosomal protein L11 methyltransferase
VPASEAELAADALWLAGASAVVEHEVDGGTVTVVGDVSGSIDGVPSHWVVSKHEVVDDGLDGWRPFALAVRAGPFTVRAPWLPAAGDGSIDLAIDPGRAFGSGSHPTTTLVLRALERLVGPSTSVLDVGCGSGVLAIAAARLGASPVVAIDVDPVAVSVTLENAVRNGVSVDVSDAPVGELGDTYDVVLANIGAAVLVDLAPALTARIAPRGTLVLSGVLEAAVLDAYGDLDLVERGEDDGWFCFALRSPEG